MQWKPRVILEMQHSILQITTWTERAKTSGLVWNQQRRKRLPSEAKAGSIYQLALRKDLNCQARSPQAPQKKSQTELRQMKDKWWQHKAAELEQYSDVHNFKRFFEGLKTVYGTFSMPWLLSHLLMEPCLQGSLISFKVGVKSLANFSTDRPVSHARYASAPGSKLSWRSPNTEGNPEKNKQLQAGKAPVADEIPPKIFKEGGEVITVKLTELMQQFWVKGSVPRDFKDANAIHLYKSKDDRTSCDNHSTKVSRCWVFKERSWHASY